METLSGDISLPPVSTAAMTQQVPGVPGSSMRPLDNRCLKAGHANKRQGCASGPGTLCDHTGDSPPASAQTWTGSGPPRAAGPGEPTSSLLEDVCPRPQAGAT